MNQTFLKWLLIAVGGALVALSQSVLAGTPYEGLASFVGTFLAGSQVVRRVTDVPAPAPLGQKDKIPLVIR